MASLANTLLWRPAPIATITVRQFLGGKAAWVVSFLAFAPCVFALIYLLRTDVNTPRGFLIDVYYRGVMAPTILPIAILILATGALGNEVEDRTLPYLVLKPISRFRIVAEKLLGVLAVGLPAILLGIFATWLIIRLGTDESTSFVAQGTPTSVDAVLWPMLASATLGVVATTAIFLLVSLVIPRALIVGILYAFAWESLLGRFLPGVKIISIRHYVESTFVALLDARDATLSGGFSVTTSVITIACAVVVSVLLATWRLSKMNLE